MNPEHWIARAERPRSEARALPPCARPQLRKAFGQREARRFYGDDFRTALNAKAPWGVHFPDGETSGLLQPGVSRRGGRARPIGIARSMREICWCCGSGRGARTAAPACGATPRAARRRARRLYVEAVEHGPLWLFRLPSAEEGGGRQDPLEAAASRDRKCGDPARLKQL